MAGTTDISEYYYVYNWSDGTGDQFFMSFLRIKEGIIYIQTDYGPRDYRAEVITFRVGTSDMADLKEIIDIPWDITKDTQNCIRFTFDTTTNKKIIWVTSSDNNTGKAREKTISIVGQPVSESDKNIFLQGVPGTNIADTTLNLTISQTVDNSLSISLGKN